MLYNSKRTASIFIILLLTSIALLAKDKKDNGQIKLINIAAKQRMLSQRIAKDYLYMHKNIASNKTKKELNNSLVNFFEAHSKLLSSIKSEDIHNLLEFVELSSNDLNETIHQKFNLDNAQLVLDLSESMLEGSQYIVDSLKNASKHKKSAIVELAGRQRMLSQRIAKYYIAYQIGIKDENTVRSMKQAVVAFNENLTVLRKNKNNTAIINKELNEVNKLWKIVHKFYNNIERGGLPLIVFNTTNKITKKMDTVTKLYLGIKNKKK
jgi:hypothetical protein